MISKQEFEDIYRQFPPSKLERFFIKNISATNSMYKKGWLAVLICIMLFIPLLVRLLFEAKIVTVQYIHIMGYFYSFLLAFIGLTWYVLWKLKKYRYHKIQKKLGISEKEFHKIIRAYYINDYDNCIDFIKYNTKRNDD